MQINKTHTSPNQKESSSLTDQKLFIRRPDITSEMRLNLAIAGLGRQFRDCTIKELESRYKISYTFIYNQSNILRARYAELFGIQGSKSKAPLEELLTSIRFFVEGKLETKGALEGLSKFATSQGIKYNSTNFISEALQLAGTLVGDNYKSEASLFLTFLCDEVYSGGQAILVTVEAQSMMVLDIRLVTGSLTSADWENSFKRMASNRVIPKIVVKDQGKQMQSATAVLPEQTLILADTFHAIAHRLGMFRIRLKKRVESCEAIEVARAIRFENTKSFPTAFKIEQEWEVAKYNTLQAQKQLASFDENYFKMIQQLRPFTSQGEPRDKQKAILIMRESIAALSLLPIDKLSKHLAHIKGLLDNGQLLDYMDQVPNLHQELQDHLDQDTSWLWMLYWQWSKKARQTHSPKVQQRSKQEALAAEDLLKEYYQGQQINQFEELRSLVFKTLDQIVQASSLVETFNSILKPFINNARGQVSQELLDLVKFYHNHRVFKRGKRKNLAPIEILTGIPLEKSWIDLLMDRIKTAFIQANVVSLKQLHQLYCKKQEKSDSNLEARDLDKVVKIAA